MPINPDLSQPVLYKDPQTGEVVPGGEDSPKATALRAELAAKRRQRLQDRYKRPEAQATRRASVTRAEASPAEAWSEDEKKARCNVGPEDVPAAVAAASPDLKTINTSLPDGKKRE